MNPIYNIVCKRPDGQEILIHSADSRNEVMMIVDTKQFAGTWIDENRKLLRYGLGLIEIREEVKVAAVTSIKVFEHEGIAKYLMELANHHEIGWLVMSSGSITAYDRSQQTLMWEVDNFAMLALRVSKEVAYDCMQYYEKLVGAGGEM